MTSDFKSRVGEKSGRIREKAPADRLEKFARSIGSSAGAEVAPPTFLTAFRRGEFDLFDQLGVPLSSILHAEQEYTYMRPIRAGEEVEFQAELTKVLEKASMSFMTFKTEFFAEGAVIATSTTTIVVRR